MKFLIKLSPEIIIKSRSVRKKAISRLRGNIFKHLDEELIDAEVSGNWDRIHVEVSDLESKEKVMHVLKNIPGIGWLSEIDEFIIPEILTGTQEEIFVCVSKQALKYFLSKIRSKSFVVRIKRSGDHDFKSPDLEAHVGGDLLEAGENTRVQLRNPDFTAEMEIKDDTLCIVKHKIQGLSGYPVGFQGKVLSLISGGFDSGVSTYSLMKRGCLVDFLFFNLGGSAHELGVKQVSHHLWKTFSLPYRNARIIIVPFEEVLKEIILKTPSTYRSVILKRCMISVASKISLENHYAIVKGDSLGQVSSQTLENLHVIDRASEQLVLRPLISMNKQEIIEVAKQIGTYDFACSMPEYCGVVSQKPSTAAKLEKIEDIEKGFPQEVLDQAIENKRTEYVREVFTESSSKGKEIEYTNTQQAGEIIIDIREPEKTQKSPLSQKGFEQYECIPFYDINHTFEKLDQDKTYLFYCDVGTLSELHGLYLKEKGFENIKVLRV